MGLGFMVLEAHDHTSEKEGVVKLPICYLHELHEEM
jgi:hypothetical protein